MQDFSINGKQTIEFLDRDLEFLAGTGAGEGLDFYDIKDVIVDYQCTGKVVLSCISTYVLSSSYFIIKINLHFRTTDPIQDFVPLRRNCAYAMKMNVVIRTE